MLKHILIACILVGTVNLTDISFYEVLGVTKEATSQEIRQAYKKLAIKLHPDKNPGAGNQEKFLKITEAYENLKDPDKRHKYDMYGSYPTYGRTYDSRSQAEYDDLYYNGLYHDDPNVETLSGNSFYNYLKEGFHFINFYSPFCPPCQKVAGHWKKLAELYKGVIKVGAVNCKYYNSFCYNSMRISSYPTLLFYTDGKDGNYIYYRGDRSLDALDAFVMKYLKSKVHIPTVTYVLETERPIAYVLGENRIGASALTRIAFQLNGLAALVLVEDDSLRTYLSEDDQVTVVFKYKGVSRTIRSSDEKEVLRGIVKHLPKVEVIDPKKLQTYRQNLRSGSATPWVLYFSAEGSDSLEFHRKRLSMPDFNFGEINCDEWSELCAALQVGNLPAWGVMKPGGAYQRVNPGGIQLAVQATNLHTLSLSEFIRTLQQDTGVWVLLVVSYQMSWNDALEPFTRASIHFRHTDVHFGIMSCTESTDHHCRRVSYDEPTVFVQNGTRRTYHGGTELHGLVKFIQTLKDSADMEITEEQVMEIIDVSSRSHVWFVAHMPARCGRHCDQLAGEWMQVYAKLRPLDLVRVGILRCDSDTEGFCANIRMPTARLYPLGSHHFSVNLQQVSEAPYLLEWALERIVDSVQKLNWSSFTKTVIAEELNPTGTKKPWLVYFHSPRCYRCYEMYPEFAIAGVKLGNAAHLGRVNCLNERGLCQHEGITSYPSLRLYLSRSARRVSSVVTVQLRDWEVVLADVNRHLDELTGSAGVRAKHDEF